MVDVYSIWNAFIKGLHTKYNTYKYIKANIQGNIPPYPYCTIGVTSSYIKESDRGIIVQENIEGSTKVNLIRKEQPTMIFSFNCYSTDLQDALQISKDTQEWLLYTGEQYLSQNGIVVVDVGNVQDRTIFQDGPEIYVYCYGFDLTIRVNDAISLETETIGTVEI